jgi:hypothetical protein
VTTEGRSPYFRAHSLKSPERNILGFYGIGPIRESLIGMVEAGEARRKKWLDKMRSLGRKGGEEENIDIYTARCAILSAETSCIAPRPCSKAVMLASVVSAMFFNASSVKKP